MQGVLRKELQGLQSGELDNVSSDTGVWSDVNTMLAAGIELRNAEQASNLSSGAVAFVRRVLSPILSSPVSVDPSPQKMHSDVLLLLENVSQFACETAVRADAVAKRNVVKEVLHISGECLKLGNRMGDEHRDAIQTLSHISVVLLRPLKAVYTDLCQLDEYHCQSFVQDLQMLALEGAVSATTMESTSSLDVWMNIVDGMDQHVHVSVLSEIVEHIGIVISMSWHKHPLQAQQDVNFLEIVSADKYIVLSVALTVLQKLDGNEDFSFLVIPLLIDMMAVQAEQLDISNHVFAIHVLGSIGIVCAKNANFWGFSTVLEIFIKLYKFPEHKISAAMMHGKLHNARSLLKGTAPGTLSSGLLHLCSGIKDAPLKFKKHLKKKLLTLFSDFALLMPNDSFRLDLGGLLPAIAAAVSNIKASFVIGRLSSALSAGDLSLEALNKIQEEGRIETSAFRHLWFCCSVYDFGSIRSTSDKWPEEWSRYLCIIASRTPLLMIGSEQQQETVFLDHIGAEFGGWLSGFGNLAEPRSLQNFLRKTVSNETVLNSNVDPEICCHLLTIAYIARCHALMTELSNIERSPIDHIIIHAQFSLSNSSEYEWYEAMMTSVFSKYLGRLSELTCSPIVAEETFALDAAAYSAVTLIESLVQQGPNDRIPPLMVQLLQSILPKFPCLYFSGETINGAIRAVATEREAYSTSLSNGSMPLSVDPRQATAGTVASKYLLDLIQSAASRAPAVIEAIVGENLRHLANMVGSSTEITSSITPSVMEALQQGRRMCSLPDSLGVYKGVIAWSSKIRALGIVDGLRMSGETGERVMLQQAQELIFKLQHRAPIHAISDGILDLAAACIAIGDETAAQKPLELLAWAPLSIVNLDIMKVSCLAWHWITSACPNMTCTLIKNITQAWLSHQNLSLGVFDKSHFSSRRNSEINNCIDVQQVWIVFWTEIWRSGGERYHHKDWSLESNMLKIAESVNGETDSSNLSSNPYSCGVRFRLLNLVLEILLSSHAIRELKPGMDSVVASRYSDIINSALAWFAVPAAWIETDPETANESAVAVSEFGVLLSKMESHLKSLKIKLVSKEKIELLMYLIDVEIARLKIWMQPTKAHSTLLTRPSKGWETFGRVAWQESPKLALTLGSRFSGVQPLQSVLQNLVLDNAGDESVQQFPEAVKYLIASPRSSGKDSAMEYLKLWKPMGLEQSISLMSKPIARDGPLFDYIIRCLELCDPKDVSFFLPQLVQLLRHDPDKGVESFLLAAASKSSYFAFLLKCQLLSEGTPPDEAFSPEVKRSNWSPPSDTGLWSIADSTYKALLASLKGHVREHLDAESEFFDEVTAVSGKLYPIPKDERKAAAVGFLSEINVKRNDLFMPFGPDTVIKKVKPETATPMQSAAKCPILVAFEVEHMTEADEPETFVEAAIFKVGDDCRQDVLALQVVEIVKKRFDEVGLPLPLVPYGVIPTGHECGIIQVVPKAKSRAQLGEITDGGLLDVFQHEFGLPGSARFEAARRRFIESSAAYAIVSYILQAKDRHNGNIMVDNTGKIIHIDFGYIFGISPGGNMGFESAAFKLSYEMTELLDPGNTRKSVHFIRFQELCVKGYLAARTVADSIVATVEMMLPSKLPCFSRGDPILSLRERFHLEMSDQEAAKFMESLIHDAYDKWTTGVYDLIQYYQNSIPK